MLWPTRFDARESVASSCGWRGGPSQLETWDMKSGGARVRTVSLDPDERAWHADLASTCRTWRHRPTSSRSSAACELATPDMAGAPTPCTRDTWPRPTFAIPSSPAPSSLGISAIRIPTSPASCRSKTAAANRVRTPGPATSAPLTSRSSSAAVARCRRTRSPTSRRRADQRRRSGLPKLQARTGDGGRLQRRGVPGAPPRPGSRSPTRPRSRRLRRQRRMEPLPRSVRRHPLRPQLPGGPQAGRSRRAVRRGRPVQLRLA